MLLKIHAVKNSCCKKYILSEHNTSANMVHKSKHNYAQTTFHTNSIDSYNPIGDFLYMLINVHAVLFFSSLLPHVSSIQNSIIVCFFFFTYPIKQTLEIFKNFFYKHHI